MSASVPTVEGTRPVFTSITNLEKINQKVLEAKEHENQTNLDEYKTQMQKQLQEIISSELGITIESIYLKENWNFPFRDSSEIKLHLEEHKTIPVCNILPNLPLHLQNIRKTDMFSLFGEKYGTYSIMIDIGDERYHNSTTHYDFIAKSGNNTASTFFHVNSCTGQTSDYYYLRCHNQFLGNSTNSNYPNEVLASLQNDKFCTIHLESWRQELVDYNEKVYDSMQTYQEMIEGNKNPENMTEIHKELQRLGLLNEMVRYAMMDGYLNIELQEEMTKYENTYGSIPEEFLDLIR